MINKETVNQIVDEFLLGKNMFLVDVQVTPDNHISVEIDAMHGVSLNDCVDLNRFIEAKLDRELEDYELEVSSAGLTEPFKVWKQYVKNVNKEVEVVLYNGLKINGFLKNVTPDYCEIELERKIKTDESKRKTLIKEIQTFNYQDIKTIKLIIRFK